MDSKDFALLLDRFSLSADDQAGWSNRIIEDGVEI
jgi:hypothetical protein